LRLHPIRQGGISDEVNSARPRWLVPVIATGFLAALAVWVVASPGQSLRAGSHHHPVTKQAASSPSIPSPSATASPSSLDQSVPDSPPPGVTWQIIDTVALPFSAGAGPVSVADGIPSGFAHTPTGALVAMVQIDFRHLIEPNFVAVTQADVANTPGRAQFFALVEADGLTNPTNPEPGTYLQLTGFQFVSYTTSTAVIQLLTARPDGSYQVSTLSVAWDGNDWQLVLQADGTDSPNQQIVSSPVGFVLWGGV
jgi:hypothetical protein